MPKKLVIFDIPLIVDLIASFLPAKDIKTCCKINRGWNTLFSPHMWREIRLVDISRRTPESNQALSRNARFIRRLQIDLMADASLLLDAHCNQLQRLSCLWDRFRARELKDKRYAQLCYDGDIEMFDVSSTPMQLIVMNPGLRKLEIACHESELGLFLDQPVLASIARCHRLAYLSLHVTGTLNQKILQDLLPNIPRTCHFFELSLKDLLRMASQGPSSRLVFEPSFQLPFKTIRFLGTMYAFGESTLMPIFRHSPDVTEVLLPMTYGYVAADMTLTLLGYCKHITKLHVPSVADDMWSTPTWRESEVLALIHEYRLQEFSMDLTYVSSKNIIPALVHCSAKTLRDVFFDNATSVFLECVLKECPELRSLSVRRPSEPHLSEWTSLEALVFTPWASSHFETLELPVIGGSWSGLAGRGYKVLREGGLEDECRDAQWILQLYWKLKSLKELQRLELLWCSTKGQALDPGEMFPLSSGMERLLLQAGMNSESMWLMNLHCER